CAGCGHTLKITGSGKPGKRYPIYYCVGRYASGLCPARASSRASTLDDYVEDRVLTLLEGESGLVAEARAAADQLDDVAQQVGAAEHELDLFIGTPKLMSILGEEKFTEGVEVRQRALDEARALLTRVR